MRKIGFWIEMQGSSYRSVEGIIRVLTEAITAKDPADHIYFVCPEDCEAPIRQSLESYNMDSRQLHFLKQARHGLMEKFIRKILSLFWRIDTVAYKILKGYEHGSLRQPLLQFKIHGNLGFVALFFLNLFLVVILRISGKIQNLFFKIKFESWQSKLLKKVNRSKMDRLIVANPAWNGWIGAKAKVTTLFWDVFSIDDPSFLEVAKCEDKIKNSLAATDRALTMSGHTRDNLVKLSGESMNHKITVAPPPGFLKKLVNTADAANHIKNLLVRKFNETHNSYLPDLPLEEMKYILCATQNRKNKNLISLISAFQILIRKHRYNLKLILTAHETPDLRKYIVENGLVFDVLFLSNLTEVELNSLFCLSEAVAIPSTFEGGIPLNLIEASEYKKPVIVSQMPTITKAKNYVDIFDYTFYPSDINGLVNAITRSIAEKDANVISFNNFVRANTVYENWNQYYKEISKN